jgi:hypothetical protein
MWKTTALLAAAAFALGGLVAAAAWGPDWRPGQSGGPAWTEVSWPFPIDQWGKGKAFRCNPAHCGAEVDLYIRPKIGFCNCTTGVSDDAELDRISDFDLFGKSVSPLTPGREIKVAWMKGRSRPFAVGATASRRSILSIGFNDHCDAIVATASVEHAAPAKLEQTVLDFLNSRIVIRWAEVALGL